MERIEDDDCMKVARKLWTDVFKGCDGHDHGHIYAIANALREAAAQAFDDAESICHDRRSDFGHDIADSMNEQAAALRETNAAMRGKP
jgi:hypothetical protein